MLKQNKMLNWKRCKELLQYTLNILRAMPKVHIRSDWVSCTEITHKHWISLGKICKYLWLQEFLKVDTRAAVWVGTAGWPHPLGAGWWVLVHPPLGQITQLHPLAGVTATAAWMRRTCMDIRLRRWCRTWWDAPALTKVKYGRAFATQDLQLVPPDKMIKHRKLAPITILVCGTLSTIKPLKHE